MRVVERARSQPNLAKARKDNANKAYKLKTYNQWLLHTSLNMPCVLNTDRYCVMICACSVALAPHLIVEIS